MTSKMQYLISLSDATIEQVIWLEKDWKIERDAVIELAINYTYNSNFTPAKSVEEAVSATVSNLAMTLIQESLDKGRKISIPSLGIVIEP